MTISAGKICLLVYTLQIQFDDMFSVATHQQSTKDRLRAFAGDDFNITIRGQCMQPVLKDGQRVPVKPSILYLPGDILVFEDQFGQILAHRLLGFFFRNGHMHFLTQADNTAGVDTAIRTEQIIGKIQHSVSLGKRISSIARFVRYASKRVATRAIR